MRYQRPDWLTKNVFNPLLTACSSKSVPPTASPLPTFKPPPATPMARSGEPTDQSPTATAEPVPTESVASATPVGIPDLVVARQGEPEELVRRALAALGGIERFVPPEASVIVKPNICNAYHTYEYASTTNPWVVSALVKLCFELELPYQRGKHGRDVGTFEPAVIWNRHISPRINYSPAPPRISGNEPVAHGVL